MIKAARKIKEVFVTFNLSLLLVCNLIFITAMQIGLVLLVGTVGTWMGWMESGFYSQPYVIAVIAFIFFILIATSVVVMIRFMFVRPLRQMCRAMQQLAQGDFSVRMRAGGHWRPLELRQFTAAFNTAAQELGNTEILRKDFINDFSHEFKTPITSLGGLCRPAAGMRRGADGGRAAGVPLHHQQRVPPAGRSGLQRAAALPHRVPDHPHRPDGI